MISIRTMRPAPAGRRAAGATASAAPSVNLAREPDFRLGGLLIRPSLREVLTAARRQRIEPRVMQVLVALARAGDRVVSRDELIARCWDGRIVGEDAINRCIGRLRRLARTVDGGFCIDTVARVGYRLREAKECARASAPPGRISGWIRRVRFALAAARALFVFAPTHPVI